jgi:hypothetical protein
LSRLLSPREETLNEYDDESAFGADRAKRERPRIVDVSKLEEEEEEEEEEEKTTR